MIDPLFKQWLFLLHLQKNTLQLSLQANIIIVLKALLQAIFSWNLIATQIWVTNTFGRQNLPASAGTFSCSRARCYTCSFLNSATSISGPKSNFVIRHNFTCTSSNIIYCISCSKCCKLYIGETGRRLSDRFAEHLRSVNKEQWCWQACCATF